MTRPVRPRLGVEALEDRTVPAVTASLAAGVLTVNLGAANDSVQLGGNDNSGTNVYVTGTGLAVQSFTGVNRILISDTAGAGGQAANFFDFPASRIAISQLLSVTGVEAVTLANDTNPVAANNITIAGAQTVRQTNALLQLSATQSVRLTAAAAGDALGLAALPLRVSATSLAADTTGGNGNQYYDLGAIANFVNVNATGAGPVNAGTGTVTLANGQFFGVGNGDEFGNATTFNMTANAIFTVGTAETIGGLTGTGRVASSTGPVTLTVGGGGVSSTFAGVIRDVDPIGTVGAGTLGLTKTGTGTFTLAGANTYTEPTTLTGTGTLLVTGSLAPASAVTAAGTDPANGAFLGGSGTIGGPVLVQANAVVGPGDTTSTATLATGSLSFQAGGQFGVKVAGGAAGQFDALTVTGAVNLTNGGIFVVPFGPTPALNTVLTVIANDGADPVVGTFTGLPQGATLADLAGNGYTVSYTGGDGNDVTLTLVARAAAALPGGVAVGGTPDGRAGLYAAGAFFNPPALQTPAGLFPGFVGEVRPAAGDFDADGFGDVVLVTGAGVETQMAIVSGRTQAVILPPTVVYPGENFTFGGYVTAGDIDNDGRAEWVITPELRGGPRVQILRLTPAGTLQIAANFFGIGDPNFRDGCRAALGDVNRDGILDVFVTAAFNGGPRTALFNGADVLIATAAGRNPNKLRGDFFASADGTDSGRGGRSIAAGDVNGDGVADLVVTGDNLLGTGNQIVVYSGADLANPALFPGGGAAVLANFTVASQPGGALVSVALANADGDARGDLFVGSGKGQASRVRTYLGATIAGTAEPAATELDPFGVPTINGVFVG